MKKIFTSVLLCFFLHTTQAQDTLYIIGQTHSKAGPSFSDTSYQNELMESQKMVKNILIHHQFQLIGDEGLSKKKGSTVYTIEEYKQKRLSEWRYKIVPWMLYEGTLSPKKLVGIEDPILHQKIVTYLKVHKKMDSVYIALQKQRSDTLTVTFLEEMKRKGIRIGAIVVGSSHITDIVAKAKEKGVVVRVYCTSRNPEQYL